MNIYHYSFFCQCPNDDKTIEYRLQIKSESMIMAEDIVKHCNHADGYQEHIASQLKLELGGDIELSATHSGVRITTLL